MKIQDTIHQNVVTDENKIYCKRAHKVVDFDANIPNCDTCPYFYGSLQGNGVECVWKDQTPASVFTVEEPNKELLRVSKLLDKKIVEKG